MSTADNFYFQLLENIQSGRRQSDDYPADYLRICAPMVRYSRMAFRRLVRLYGIDLAFTPMIMADCFVKSERARDIDLTTDDAHDCPLVVQFGASNASDFVSAVQTLAEGCQRSSNPIVGVDLNCGCPQRWAIKEGIGSSLMFRPDDVADIVKTVKLRNLHIPTPSGDSIRGQSMPIAVSAKIRLHDDLRQTVSFCRQLESAGIAMISVHGRTVKQKRSALFPANYDAVRELKEAVNVPLIVNGDITSKAKADEVWRSTNCDGVMVARGLLANPAMFAPSVQPRTYVRQFIQIALETGLHFTVLHHHLIYMLDPLLTTKTEKRLFNSLTSLAAVVDFIDDRVDEL